MDPMNEEQLDYGDEDYGGASKMQYHEGGAISALAEDEVLGEDDDYDDLYNDVNVGEGFMKMQHSEAPSVAGSFDSGGLEGQRVGVPEAMASQGLSIPGVAPEVNYPSAGLRSTEQKEGMSVNLSKGSVPQKANDVEGVSMGFQGQVPELQKTVADPIAIPGNVKSEPPPLINSNTGGPRGFSQMPANQIGGHANLNVERPMVNGNQLRPAVENSNPTIFIGELHWWTTDAEIENACSQYGRVKEVQFFDERASGKSKGYCQVEFYDPAAAAACKEGMNGYVFNGRPCVVAFASPQTMRQMGASYANKSQPQAPSQPQQPQGGRPLNDGVGRSGGTNFSGGDSGTGRNYGRGGWGRGGSGIPNRGGGNMRGRGGNFGPRNAGGPGFGNGPNGGAYGGQDLSGPAFGGPSGGFMHPQAMMGTGFDPTYMARGTGYGGFPGPAFPGMMPQFPPVNSMGLPAVAPHVNPAFFGRGVGASGMGMMGTPGMDGSNQSGMWGDPSMGNWAGGEEQGQRTRESSYGGEDGASEYGYGEVSHDKGVRSNAVSREKDRSSEREYSEKRHRDRDEKEQDRDRYDKDYRYREEKHAYRDNRYKDRDSGYRDEWDRGQSSTRSRSRSRAMPEDGHHRSHSRDADYGKRRRMTSD